MPNRGSHRLTPHTLTSAGTTARRSASLMRCAAASRPAAPPPSAAARRSRTALARSRTRCSVPVHSMHASSSERPVTLTGGSASGRSAPHLARRNDVTGTPLVRAQRRVGRRDRERGVDGARRARRRRQRRARRTCAARARRAPPPPPPTTSAMSARRGSRGQPARGGSRGAPSSTTSPSRSLGCPR